MSPHPFRSLLHLLTLFGLALAACSAPEQLQAHSTPTLTPKPIVRTNYTPSPTPQATATVTPSPNKPAYPYPDPEFVERLGEQTSTSERPYPYPEPPEKFPTAPPTILPTLTPSPTLVLPTATLPPSLVGLQILYYTDGSLWRWQNGQNERLTVADDYTNKAEFSSDGRQIAFQRVGGLWVIDSDGIIEKQLLSREDFASFEPRDPGVSLSQFGWGPGIQGLLFNTVMNLDYGIWRADDLYWINSMTGQLAQIRRPGAGGLFTFSPDGSRVALVTPETISVMNKDGGGFRQLYEYPLVFTYSEFNYYARPSWTPDGQALLVAIPPPDPMQFPDAPTEIWKLPVNGAAAVKLSEIHLAQMIRQVDISPDGTKIAYLFQPPNAKMIELLVSNLDGTHEQSIFSAERSQSGDFPIWFVSWLPDSQCFLYWIKPGGYQLGCLSGTSMPFPIPDTFYYSGVIWVDEQSFLFGSQAGNRMEYRLVFLDGTSRVLIDGPRMDFRFLDFFLPGETSD